MSATDSLRRLLRLQRRGVASSLLQHVEAAAGRRFLAVAPAAANRPALELYRGRGFLEISRALTRDGLELVFLRKSPGSRP